MVYHTFKGMSVWHTLEESHILKEMSQKVCHAKIYCLLSSIYRTLKLVQLSYMTDDTLSSRNEGKTELTFELFWRPLDDDGSPLTPALSPCSIDSKKKLRVEPLPAEICPLELDRGLFELSSLKRTTFRPRMASWLLLRKPKGPQVCCFTLQSIVHWKEMGTFLDYEESVHFARKLLLVCIFCHTF